jgi:hypothetical protein
MPDCHFKKSLSAILPQDATNCFKVFSGATGGRNGNFGRQNREASRGTGYPNFQKLENLILEILRGLVGIGFYIRFY